MHVFATLMLLITVPRHVVRDVFRRNFPLVRNGTIEHVVPQSLDPSLKRNVHNLLWLPRHLNCARGNKRLCVKTTRSTWEPPDVYKGLYARSILYTGEFQKTLDEELAWMWHTTFPPTPAEQRASLTLGLLQGDINHNFFDNLR